MKENKKSEEDATINEPMFKLPINNIRNSKTFKKGRKKPDINIPIFEINVAYYEKKKLKKHKNKKKEKENPANTLNNYIMNNSQINFGNNIGNINTIKNIRNNPNNNNTQPKEKENIFIYNNEEETKNINEIVSDNEDKKSITNKSEMSYKIPLDLDFLSTATSDDAPSKNEIYNNSKISKNNMNSINNNNNYTNNINNLQNLNIQIYIIKLY